MKVELNTNKKLVEDIRSHLNKNNGYCPCQIGHTEDTKCMCKDFKERVPVGEYCICELYKKIAD